MVPVTTVTMARVGDPPVAGKYELFRSQVTSIYSLLFEYMQMIFTKARVWVTLEFTSIFYGQAMFKISIFIYFI